MKFKLKAGDFIIGFIFVIIFGLFLFLGFLKKDSSLLNIAVVNVCEDEYIYPLDKNQRIELNGKLGPVLLVIEDNTIRFESSTCRDHICIKMGRAGNNNTKFLACLPNQVIVTISGNKENEIDITN